jgi:hypothetical protein
MMPEGDKTKVVILLSNAPAGVAQPAHIHLGQCDNLDKAPKWAGSVETPVVTVVPASIDAILKDRTAINVHKAREIRFTCPAAAS